ncbi:hypothetical protein [Rhodococcus kronopolitis]|uniref:Uncharacterized protein n=1 Tax=Rhodococcus kronopolitis TaxID=1460226 RepID=A0ABV9FQ32_9NOCA
MTVTIIVVAVFVPEFAGLDHPAAVGRRSRSRLGQYERRKYGGGAE